MAVPAVPSPNGDKISVFMYYRNVNLHTGWRIWSPQEFHNSISVVEFTKLYADTLKKTTCKHDSSDARVII